MMMLVGLLRLMELLELMWQVAYSLMQFHVSRIYSPRSPRDFISTGLQPISPSKSHKPQQLHQPQQSNKHHHLEQLHMLKQLQQPHQP